MVNIGNKERYHNHTFQVSYIDPWTQKDLTGNYICASCEDAILANYLIELGVSFKLRFEHQIYTFHVEAYHEVDGKDYKIYSSSGQSENRDFPTLEEFIALSDRIFHEVLPKAAEWIQNHFAREAEKRLRNRE